MTVTPEQLEWIVQEVIRRLRLLDSNPPPAGELRLTDKLITMATLKDRLASVTRVSVPPRAVVTPAVRDELKQRRIELNQQNQQ